MAFNFYSLYTKVFERHAICQQQLVDIHTTLVSGQNIHWKLMSLPEKVKITLNDY